MSEKHNSKTIGILGGGQLGRMLTQAAQRLGMKAHIFAPEENAPAFQVTPLFTQADYADETALTAFADSVDVITYEFENVPLETAHFLDRLKPVHPGTRALEVGQNRVTERAFLVAHDVPTTPHHIINSADDMNVAFEKLSGPLILKTTRLGYDGKGQMRVANMDAAQTAITELGLPLMAEKLIDFTHEISAIVARDTKGQTVAFDPAENVHKNHILDTSTVPCSLSVPLQETAQQTAIHIANQLDYIGVLAVEYFVVHQNGQPGLLVNEIAPRVHNSGHWTQDGCAHSQFEQHMRAVAGLPLGTPKRHADVVMHNLIGDDLKNWPDHLAKGGCVHLYGKGEMRPGRKMGHVNYLKR